MNKLKPTNKLNGAHNVLSEFTEHYKDIAKPHNPDADAELAHEVNQIMATGEFWELFCNCR